MSDIPVGAAIEEASAAAPDTANTASNAPTFEGANKFQHAISAWRSK
jgi:hypothetical protein